MQVLVILVIMLLFFLRRAHNDLPSDIKKKRANGMFIEPLIYWAGKRWLERSSLSGALAAVFLYFIPFLFVMAPLAISQASLYASSSMSLSESRQGGRPDSLLCFLVAAPSRCERVAVWVVSPCGGSVLRVLAS